MITIIGGWKTFLHVKKFPALLEAAEAMYRLNVYARHAGRNTLTEQIYELKDKLIKYLYLNGYCVEVKLHEQKRMCYSCDGTGVYYNGDECWKCNGTGVFSVTPLYALRFVIDGYHYSWHQLKKLVDYDITLTDCQVGEFKELPPTPAILTLEQAWEDCCLVWWTLLWLGVRAEFVLFSQTRRALAAKWRALWKLRDPDIPF